MNEGHRLIVKEFKGKIAELMARFNGLEAEKKQLKNELAELQKQIEVLEHEKATLENKYENLKIAKLVSADYNDNQAAKQKINKLLREIDNCIALLNK